MKFNKIAAILMAGTVYLPLNSGCKKIAAAKAKVPLKTDWYC